MRDLVVSLLIVGLLPACFRRPFVGLLIFSWLAYMRVQDLTWGEAREQRWSFYVAVVTFAGWLASNRSGRMFQPDLRNWIMMGIAALVGIGVLVAEEVGPVQVARYIEFVKIVGIALFTTGVVRTREQLRILVWVIALSLGFYGVKSGVMGILTLGRMEILRGPGGMLRDNNDFSLALCMAVPMLWHVGLAEKREILRRAFLVAVPLTCLTVLLTHSRGGMVALSGTLCVLVWRSRNRIGGFAVLGLLGVAALIAAPAGLRERALSIKDYEEDSSANARFDAWAVAVRMAVDNPWVGVGFNRFGKNYLRYEPNPSHKQLSGEAIFVAHNSYLQIWAECGTPALLLYLSLIGLSFATVWRVRALARQRYYSSWIINYATMFEASLVAFVIGSTFLNRAHFDLFYHWVAIILVFGLLAQQEMAGELPRTQRAGGRGAIVARGRGGFGHQPRVRGFRTPLGPIGTTA